MGSVEGGEGRNSKHLVNLLRVQESMNQRGSSESMREETFESSGVDMIRQMYDQEFKDLADDREGLSVNDREWLKEVKSNIRKDDSGHYEIGLPKSDVSNLPDSLPVAEKRLNSLRRRFERDSNFFEQYKAVILSVIVILAVKALLQELCAMKCDWDGPIPQPLSFEWERWLSDAQKLDSVELGRCVLKADVIETLMRERRERGY